MNVTVNVPVCPGLSVSDAGDTTVLIPAIPVTEAV